MIVVVAIIHFISAAIFQNKSSWSTLNRNFVLLEMLSQYLAAFIITRSTAQKMKFFI